MSEDETCPDCLHDLHPQYGCDKKQCECNQLPAESSKEKKEMSEVQAVPNNNPNICPHCGTNSDNQTRCCRKIDSLLQLVWEMRKSLFEFGSHDSRCQKVNNISRKCSCGFKDIFQKADSFLKEHGGANG